jgi:hypothetical protein
MVDRGKSIETILDAADMNVRATITIGSFALPSGRKSRLSESSFS